MSSPLAPAAENARSDGPALLRDPLVAFHRPCERRSHHSPVRHVGVQRHLSRYERTAPRVQPIGRPPASRAGLDTYNRGNQGNQGQHSMKVGKSGHAMTTMAAMQP